MLKWLIEDTSRIELVHICEEEFERTRTKEDVAGLLEKLLGPLSTEDYGVSDYMAGKDRLAMYQALGILFPPEARAQAMEALDKGSSNIAKIAEWVCLPIHLVSVVLQPEWPSIIASLTGVGDA